jgi:hypothetical protein
MNAPMNPWIAIAVIAVVAAISNLFKLWTHNKGLKAVTRWADQQGFTIVELSRRLFVPLWRADLFKRNQYFRVSLRDKQGNVRQAWIRCYPFGFTNDPDSVELEVIWDEK